MTDDNIRRYWCEVLGREWHVQGVFWRADSTLGDPAVSDADLAEAVRKWWMNDNRAYTLRDSKDGEGCTPVLSDPSIRIAVRALFGGPLAFLRAVKEVVDDGR